MSKFWALLILAVMCLLCAFCCDAQAQAFPTIAKIEVSGVGMGEVDQLKVDILQKDYLIAQQQLQILQLRAEKVQSELENIQKKFNEKLDNFKKERNLPADWTFDMETKSFKKPEPKPADPKPTEKK